MELELLLLVLGLLLILMAVGTPISLALAGAGAVGLLALEGPVNVTNTLGGIPFASTARYSLILIPSFILMGIAASRGGIVDSLFTFAQRIVGRLPGGLAAAASLGAVMFGGISGASVADAATIGRISINEMAQRGYDRQFAAAVVAAGGTAAILIPPSITLVIYGTLSGESIGKLLLAGIGPGVLTAVVEISLIVYLCHKHGYGKVSISEESVIAGSGGAATLVQDRTESSLATAVGVIVSGVLMVTVVGGIYTGFFTATEAGAVGAIAALVLIPVHAVATKKGSWRTLSGFVRETYVSSIRESAGLTSSIFLIIVGGTLFSHFLVLARVPSTITEWIVGLPISPLMIAALFLVALIPLGMLVDGLSLLLIATPLAYPVLTGLGFDGILLGVLLVKVIEIGLITPPVGLNIYVVASLDSRLRPERIFRRLIPFVVADILVTAILLAVPAITLWLPETANIGG